MIALHIPNDCHIFLKYLLYSSSVHSFHCKLDFKDKRLLGDRGRGRKKKSGKKEAIQKATIRPNVEKLQKRQEEQNGITLCRGDWTINYISQKEAQWNSPATHSANSAPLLDTHIHKDNTHTHTPIFPKQLKRQRWSPHFRQIKLQFIFQLYPKLTLSTSSLSSLKGISQSQVCVRVERKRGEEKKKKSGMFYFLNIIPEKPSFKKKKGGGGRQDWGLSSI